MIVDTNKCDLTVSEIGALLFLYDAGKCEKWEVGSVTNTSILQVFEKLMAKGLLTATLLPNNFKYTLSINGRMDLKNIISKDIPENTEDRCTSLADKLKQIYPDGKKPGTTFFWKDSTTVIAERLKKFFLKYGDYSDEEIIDATKRYVMSFNGDYRYMQLLKYFIWKNKVTGGELVEGRLVGEVEKQSQLAAYIENKNESPAFTNDWDLTLK